ncbi:MAG: alpha-amylase family glycosyl hydrolase [Bacilli bacterium]|nr:alpha-amylase family glycosyl hydrolase [Bacilli bacterium]
MKIFAAYFDDFNIITVNLLLEDYHDNIKSFKLYDENNNKYINTFVTRMEDDDNYTYISLGFKYSINIPNKYYLVDENGFKRLISYRLITHTLKFDELFYTDEPLGVIYKENETIFRLWAPTSDKVILNLDNEYFPMKRLNKGIYEVTIKKQCLNLKYHYLVSVNGVINEVIDPYARLSTKNGTYSIVCNNEALNELHPVSFHDSIYEISVRDYSDNRDFKSLIKRIPYIKNLNVTTVQLMPVFDFASVDELNKDYFYNWGYDPLQYFCFEGSYSDNYLEDFKLLIKAFHDNDLNVTIDEVFNHVFDIETFSLNKIVPFYYFKYFNYPSLKRSKHSGCQNDFRSEAKMSYRFYKDILTYLIKYFDIDGVRFDLMGLLDLKTIQKLEKDLREIKPSIILYGEGWNMNHQMVGATLENASFLETFSYFNDYYRDNVINLLKGDYSKWYYVLDVMKGNHAKDFINPLQSINYIECHDGYTFYDNIVRFSKRSEQARKVCDLGMVMVTFAQGIAFFHQGQEVYHSKNGYRNSYNLGDKINHINTLDNDNLLAKLMKIRHDFKDCFFNSYEDIAKYVKIEMVNDVIFYQSKNLRVIINYSDKSTLINEKHQVLLTNSMNTHVLDPLSFIIYRIN